MPDARGCPVGTSSRAAVDHFERASWRLSSFYGTPLEDLEAASQADPGWALPRIAHAGFLLTLTEHRLLGEARTALEQAAAIIDRAPGRERGHLVAARLCLAGQWHEACRQWDALLLEHPRDHLALQLAHLFDFYRGDAHHLRQRVARVLPQWPRDDELYPYVLGMHAFGLEECKLYAEAEDVGREAVSGEARVPWAIHAVSHVMEMQGRHEEGRRWLLDRRAGWAEDANGMAVHNWWHLALFHLEAMDTAGALRIYDDAIAGLLADDVTLQRLDASSLLWRLHLMGVDVGQRWNALADAWQRDEAAAGHYAFNDVHAMMALAASGRIAQAEALAQRTARRAEASGGSNGGMHREVGAPLMQGLLDFARGRHEAAARTLYDVRPVAQRFGGSHAQRDVIDQTLLACAARAGSESWGRAVLNERELGKPVTPLTRYWAGRLARR